MKHTQKQALPPPEPTPAALGYAMPPEWAPHEGTWLAWPHNPVDWPGRMMLIPPVFAEMVRHLTAGERVHLLVPPHGGNRAIAEIVEVLMQAGADTSRVTLHAVATDRAWVRDSGPVFVTREGGGKHPAGNKNAGATLDGERADVAIVDFKFNGWAKYDNSAQDDAVPAAVARLLGKPRFTAYARNDRGEYQRFVLEGGAIDVNGAGALLTTQECLLSKVQQRNPGFSRPRIEEALRDLLGVQQVLWLGRGIAGDTDTHGHVDDTARFANTHTIVACVEPNRKDANFGATQDNLRRIARMRDLRHRPFDIAELPLPAPVYFAGKRLPASYANFFIANAGVLVPVFNDPCDAVALRILEQCFRDRPILPVYCRDLVWGLGAIHCLTQQQPEGPVG